MLEYKINSLKIIVVISRLMLLSLYIIILFFFSLCSFNLIYSMLFSSSFIVSTFIISIFLDFICSKIFPFSLENVSVSYSSFPNSFSLKKLFLLLSPSFFALFMEKNFYHLQLYHLHDICFLRLFVYSHKSDKEIKQICLIYDNIFPLLTSNL